MFLSFNDFNKDEEFGDNFSYATYNNELLRVVDFYGRTPFDWYRNKKTGEIIWLDGHAEIDHYFNLGHTWGKTFKNGDRLLLDGDTRKVTYNDEIIYNFNKKKSNLSRGYAFSDGGNSQNPSALNRGGRNVTWIDFGGLLEALTIIFAFEVRGKTSKGKGTNGGKPTQENKADDFINATDFGANAAKTMKSAKEEARGKEKESPKVKDSVTVLTYKDGKLINEERKPKL